MKPQDNIFAFNESNLVLAEQEIAKYPKNHPQSAIMALLDLAQRQHGYVSTGVIETVAKMVDVAPIQVWEVVTFYTMYHQEPVGKHHVQICTNISCMLRGSDQVVAAAKQRLGIDFGETTKDQNFTLSEVECLGACVNAPMMQVNDDYYEDLTPQTVVKLLDHLEKGLACQAGPQVERQFSAPFGGALTLKTIKTEKV